MVARGIVRQAGDGAGSAVSQPAAPVQRLLQRLDYVRASTEGWTARCPAHDDREPSLAVAIGADGRALVHCFAGCDAQRIVAAVGLELSDLFEHPCEPDDQGTRRPRPSPSMLQSYWRAALSVLDREATIIWLAGQQLAGGTALAPADAQRLDVACERVADARRVLHDR